MTHQGIFHLKLLLFKQEGGTLHCSITSHFVD